LWPLAPGVSSYGSAGQTWRDVTSYVSTGVRGGAQLRAIPVEKLFAASRGRPHHSFFDSDSLRQYVLIRGREVNVHSGGKMPPRQPARRRRYDPRGATTDAVVMADAGEGAPAPQQFFTLASWRRRAVRAGAGASAPDDGARGRQECRGGRAPRLPCCRLCRGGSVLQR
jgi:hypothetical protein